MAGSTDGRLEKRLIHLMKEIFVRHQLCTFGLVVPATWTVIEAAFARAISRSQQPKLLSLMTSKAGLPEMTCRKPLGG
jgi:hypothetical protein